MPTTVQQPTVPQQRQFTVEEYYRLADTGVLHPDDNVELLDGHIYVMSPIGSEHAACVDRLTRLFVLRAGEHATVRVQNPIRLDETSEPEPDLALVSPRDDDYADRHPRPDEALLVVEVADTSFAFDRDTKGPLCARAGIPELWIVTLETERVHVYRTPSEDRYNEHDTVGASDEVTVSRLPDLTPIPVNPILGT